MEQPKAASPGNAPQVAEPIVSYSSILEEHDVARAQQQMRAGLLREIASSTFNDDDSPNAVIAHLSKTALSSEDIPVLGNVLLALGDVKTLNLIIHSPGGDGMVVEKFVSLCRGQCQRFRVLVPNEAKSAATLIALGADEIVMGPQSELGPIDAQVRIVVSNVPRFISAQSYIDARDNLLKQYTEQVSKGENTGATMQMLATLDLPFVAECEHLMEFGREVARKFLNGHMFRTAHNRAAKVKKVVDTMSSVKRFKVHGRTINGQLARELGLKVDLRSAADAFWQKIWQYYTRADMALGRAAGTKLFETEHELLMATPAKA